MRSLGVKEVIRKVLNISIFACNNGSSIKIHLRSINYFVLPGLSNTTLAFKLDLGFFRSAVALIEMVRENDHFLLLLFFELEIGVFNKIILYTMQKQLFR